MRPIAERAWGLLAAVPILLVGMTLGWCIGLFESTRINTVAARYYVDALDVEAEARHKVDLASAQAACLTATADLKRAAAKTDRAWQLRLEEESTIATEQILGLRTTLRAHGIQVQR